MRSALYLLLITVLSLLSCSESFAQPCSSTVTYDQGFFCQGRSYNFHGRLLTAQGTYYDTIVIAGGCDSIISLQLYMIPTIHTDVYDTLRLGHGAAIFGSRTLTTAGVYYDTLYSLITGCDSAITLHLYRVNIPPVYITSTDTLDCSRTAYFILFHNYTAAGTYIDTLVSGAGVADTIITTHLYFPQHLPVHYHTDSICAYARYFFDGHTYSPGTYGVFYGRGARCDSVVVLTVLARPTVTVTFYDTFCMPAYYYFHGANNYNSPGTYIEYWPSSAGGCDTVAVLHLASRSYFPYTPLTVRDTVLCRSALLLSGAAV